MGATWSSLEETGPFAGITAPSPVAVPDDDMPSAPMMAAKPRVRRDFVASPALRLALSNYTGSAIETDASSSVVAWLGHATHADWLSAPWCAL